LAALRWGGTICGMRCRSQRKHCNPHFAQSPSADATGALVPVNRPPSERVAIAGCITSACLAASCTRLDPSTTEALLSPCSGCMAGCLKGLECYKRESRGRCAIHVHCRGFLCRGCAKRGMFRGRRRNRHLFARKLRRLRSGCLRSGAKARTPAGALFTTLKRGATTGHANAKAWCFHRLR
jgi:hypothetical protein